MVPPLLPFPSVSSLALPCFFSPSLHRRYPASSLLRLLLSSSPLSRRRSPQVRCRYSPLAPSGSTACVSDDFWALLFPASLPPAPGLTADSCFYGRRFATRFFRLRLTATPCVSLRLSSSTPSSSFHLYSLCPCWAHWGRQFCLRAGCPAQAPQAPAFSQSDKALLVAGPPITDGVSAFNKLRLKRFFLDTTLLLLC
jgi:hypothetical protein